LKIITLVSANAAFIISVISLYIGASKRLLFDNL
jgi:hypothetical protein